MTANNVAYIPKKNDFPFVQKYQSDDECHHSLLAKGIDASKIDSIWVESFASIKKTLIKENICVTEEHIDYNNVYVNIYYKNSFFDSKICMSFYECAYLEKCISKNSYWSWQPYSGNYPYTIGISQTGTTITGGNYYLSPQHYTSTYTTTGTVSNLPTYSVNTIINSTLLNNNFTYKLY